MYKLFVFFFVGRNLFPATGYLFLVWETIAQLKNHLPFDVAVVFEHVKFRRAVTITKGETVDFEIAIRAHDGYFEVRVAYRKYIHRKMDTLFYFNQ